jgi:uncharacterized repeat protein (TIGR03943 family)
MTRKLENILRAMVLAGGALMLYAKISDGTLAFYINQRFAWLTLVGVLLFVALSMAMAYRALEERRQPAQPALDALEDGVVLPLTRNAPKAHSHRANWLTLGLLALPVLIGFFTPARPLGAGAIEARGIGLSAPDRPGSVTQAQHVETGPKNILDWLREFSRNADPSAFAGKEADVIGFVYRDPRNGANEFWVSRFAVSCCVADASALGLLVKSDQAAQLQADSWVRVTGKFAVGEFAGEQLPVLIPDKIEPTEQPSQPYLYP